MQRLCDAARLKSVTQLGTRDLPKEKKNLTTVQGSKETSTGLGLVVVAIRTPR